MPTARPNKLPKSAILAVVALAIAACAPVGPDFVRPDVPTNPGWLEEERDAFENDAADLKEWWRTLDDPVLVQERGDQFTWQGGDGPLQTPSKEALINGFILFKSPYAYGNLG